MTNTADLQSALAAAKTHLRRAQEELDRYEPIGHDHRNVLGRLLSDVTRAENDVDLLERALRAAEHADEAFALFP